MNLVAAINYPDNGINISLRNYG